MPSSAQSSINIDQAIIKYKKSHPSFLQQNSCTKEGLNSLPCPKTSCSSHTSLKCPSCQRANLKPSSSSFGLTCPHCYFFQKKTYCSSRHEMRFSYIQKIYKDLIKLPKESYTSFLKTLILTSLCFVIPIYLTLNILTIFYWKK
jgi:hypothetical protein